MTARGWRPTWASPSVSDAWRQWVVSWTPTEGRHTIKVRATDQTGTTQTPGITPPAPNGATGWHTIEVSAA